MRPIVPDIEERDVTLYQTFHDSRELVENYKDYINIYVNLIDTKVINMRNPEIRYFLSLYIEDPRMRKNLRSKKPKKETVKYAYKALQYILYKFHNYTREEIFNELLIPFFAVADRYRRVGHSFQTYLTSTYCYRLYEHIKSMSNDLCNYSIFVDDFSLMESKKAIQTHETKTFEELLEDEYDLNNPKWIHGKESEYPFSEMKSHERYILVQYYVEKKTDKEISRNLPYHPKSVARIRYRLIQKIKDCYTKGEIKCLRLMTS